jgi:hypothetical protein
MGVYGKITQYIAQGKLKTKIHAEYPVSEIKQAVAAAAQGGRDGKILGGGEYSLSETLLLRKKTRACSGFLFSVSANYFIARYRGFCGHAASHFVISWIGLGLHTH